MKGLRLQLVLAKAGVASRRRAEGMIAAGEVTVNGQVVKQLGTRVDPVRDQVAVRGQVLRSEAPVYLLLYKPKGYVTTAADPEGRQTVFSLIGDEKARLFAVGRLDFNTEGALLLTNDGPLAHVLMHPSHGVPKVYHAKFRGVVTKDQLRRLREGVELPPAHPDARLPLPLAGEGRGEGPVERSAPAQVQVVAETGKHTWLEVVLHEGKNRQLHRMAQAVGSSLLKLIRVQYANLSIDGLKPGEHRRLGPEEVADLRRLAGQGPARNQPAGRRRPVLHP